MPDPDLEIRGSPKKFFLALRASVWFKNKGVGPSPGFATAKSRPKQQLQQSIDVGSRRKKKTKTAWRHTVEKERKEESRDDVKMTAAN